MSDFVSQRVTRKLRTARTGGARKMYTGKLLPDGNVTLDGGVNKVWVRASEQSREAIPVWGTVLRPHVPVWVKNGPNGKYIDSPVYEEGTVKFGAALSGLVNPTVVGDVTGISIGGLGFKPGRLSRSALGGLYIHVDAFHFDGGYWRGGEPDQTVNGGLNQTAHDVDLAGYVPATPYAARWVRGYLDPVDGSLHFIAGASVDGGISNLDEAGIIAIPLPYAVTPLGAAALENGMTAWGNNPRFVDPRLHLNTNGIVSPGWLAKYDTTLPIGAILTQPGSIRITASLAVHGELYAI